jgi:hypothetical protein
MEATKSKTSKLHIMVPGFDVIQTKDQSVVIGCCLTFYGGETMNKLEYLLWLSTRGMMLNNLHDTMPCSKQFGLVSNQQCRRIAQILLYMRRQP